MCNKIWRSFRWWITKFGISFGSVDTADQIFFLKEATKLKDKKMITLKSFLNHSILPPKYGDLIIYKKQLNNKNFQYGHVAVVVDVNLKEHFIEVAEQNYNNKPWKELNKYSRKISLKLKDGLYFLNDEMNNPILGWISL